MTLYKFSIWKMEIAFTFGLNFGFGVMYVPGSERMGIVFGPFAIVFGWNDMDDWDYDDMDEW